MKEQKVDEFRSYLMQKLYSLNGIKTSEKASYNQRRLARRRMTVYFEVLAKYNEVLEKQRKEKEADHV